MCPQMLTWSGKPWRLAQSSAIDAGKILFVCFAMYQLVPADIIADSK